MIDKIIHTLAVLLGPRTQKWEQASGHSDRESVIIIRIEGLKKGQLRRLHAQIEDLMEGEHGPGCRE